MIRLRTQKDDPAICRLVETELVPRSSLPLPGPSGIREEMRRRLRRGRTYVATGRRRSPLGFVRLERRGATLFIDLLAVASAEQRKRWGSRLMDAAEAYGRARGCVEARLFVDERNDAAMRFYLRRGYYPYSYVAALRCHELVKPLALPPPAGGGFSFDAAPRSQDQNIPF